MGMSAVDRDGKEEKEKEKEKEQGHGVWRVFINGPLRDAFVGYVESVLTSPPSPSPTPLSLSHVRCVMRYVCAAADVAADDGIVSHSEHAKQCKKIIEVCVCV